MTWELATALIAIITFGIAIGKIISALSQTLTKLSCAIDALKDTLDNFMKRSEKEHNQMHDDIGSLKQDVADHDKRITILEEK